jgi:hypothetical protein
MQARPGSLGQLNKQPLPRVFPLPLLLLLLLTTYPALLRAGQRWPVR